MLLLLQWSRSVLAAEGNSDVVTLASGGLPSMEPQLVSCGRVWVVGMSYFAFPASMEPQLVSCGRVAWIDSCVSTVMLQWSRSLLAAEGLRVAAVGINEFLASMEPQLVSCGRIPYFTLSAKGEIGFNGAAAC